MLICSTFLLHGIGACLLTFSGISYRKAQQWCSSVGDCDTDHCWWKFIFTWIIVDPDFSGWPRCELCPYLKICIREILSHIKGALVELNETLYLFFRFHNHLKNIKCFCFYHIICWDGLHMCMCNSAFKLQLL